MEPWLRTRTLVPASVGSDLGSGIHCVTLGEVLRLNTLLYVKCLAGLPAFGNHSINSQDCIYTFMYFVYKYTDEIYIHFYICVYIYI